MWYVFSGVLVWTGIKTDAEPKRVDIVWDWDDVFKLKVRRMDGDYEV